MAALDKNLQPSDHECVFQQPKALLSLIDFPLPIHPFNLCARGHPQSSIEQREHSFTPSQVVTTTVKVRKGNEGV